MSSSNSRLKLSAVLYILMEYGDVVVGVRTPDGPLYCDGIQ